MDDATNPGAPEVDGSLPTSDQPAAEPRLDDYGNPVEPEPQEDSAEIEHAEIEHGGKTYRIPKALKDGFLMQSDYTRKTQALAQDKQAFEAERTQLRQLSQAGVSAQANILAIDTALSEYQLIDWRTWFETNPQAAQAARIDFDELKERRQQAVEYFGHAQQTRHMHEQQDTARRLQQGHAELARDIPGWGQDKAAALLDFGQQHYGFSRAELDAISDPRMIKVLSAAHEHVKATSRQKATQQLQAQQSVRPASKLGGGTTPPRPLDDRASTDAWMKARDQQVTRRNAGR